MGDIKFKITRTEEERVKFANEVLESGSNILIAKKYDIHPCLLSRWVTNFRRYGNTLGPKNSKKTTVIPNYKKEYKKYMEKTKELELEVQILRDLLKKNSRP